MSELDVALCMDCIVFHAYKETAGYKYDFHEIYVALYLQAPNASKLYSEIA